MRCPTVPSDKQCTDVHSRAHALKPQRFKTGEAKNVLYFVQPCPESFLCTLIRHTMSLIPGPKGLRTQIIEC